MLRLMTGLSAVAAIASIVIAWPSATAQSPLKMTAKRAELMGLPPPAKTAADPMVSRLIVKMRDSNASDLAQPFATGHLQALSARAGMGMKAVRAMAGHATLMQLDAPVRLSEAKAIAARLASDPMVEYAEPDVMLKVQLAPVDPDYTPRQWNLFDPTAMYTGAVTGTPPPPSKTAAAAGAANLPPAWDIRTDASTVVVAIIDTGIVNHRDLNNMGLTPFSDTYVPNGAGGRFLLGYDFVSTNAGAPILPAGFVENDADPGRDNDPSDPGDWIEAADKTNFPDLCDDGDPGLTPSSWHGSHSAGVVAASSTSSGTGIDMAGIAWGARILPVRAMGKCGGSVSDISDAIWWAAGGMITGAPNNTNPAKVISIGAGTPAGTLCNATIQASINFAISQGAVVIAATGNSSAFELSSPANCANVIAVTGNAINGENWGGGNIGPAGGAGPNPTISAASGGSPASLGALGPIDDPAWAGFYVWSTALHGLREPLSTNGATPPLTGPAILGRVGTSAAAAQVAGGVALMKAKRPTATAAQVTSALMTSARPHPDLSSCAPGRVWAGRCGIGLFDAARALQATDPPTVTTQPRSTTVSAGQPATFTVEATAVVSYQWKRGGAPIAGATNAQYTLAQTAAGDNNVSFTVDLTNTFGTTTSSAAVLTVNSGSNSPSGGGALPLWQLLLLASLLLANRVRIAQREQ